MRLLLDTHAFIWWDSAPQQLSKDVLAWLRDPNNTIILSVVSLWEMQIKHQLGKLSLARQLQDIVVHQQTQNSITLLDISAQHVYELAHFPHHHCDPFDRLLVAQARVEGAKLLSKDPQLKAYPVDVT
jgi:PIN domain nuclease of toxin-antitoxin system